MIYSGAVLGVWVTWQMSSQTTRQTVREGGIFSKVQMGYDIANCNSQ